MWVGDYLLLFYSFLLFDIQCFAELLGGETFLSLFEPMYFVRVGLDKIGPVSDDFV